MTDSTNNSNVVAVDQVWFKPQTIERQETGPEGTIVNIIGETIAPESAKGRFVIEEFRVTPSSPLSKRFRDRVTGQTVVYSKDQNSGNLVGIVGELQAHNSHFAANILNGLTWDGKPTVVSTSKALADTIVAAVAELSSAAPPKNSETKADAAPAAPVVVDTEETPFLMTAAEWARRGPNMVKHFPNAKLQLKDDLGDDADPDVIGALLVARAKATAAGKKFDRGARKLTFTVTRIVHVDTLPAKSAADEMAAAAVRDILENAGLAANEYVVDRVTLTIPTSDELVTQSKKEDCDLSHFGVANGKDYLA